MRRWAVAWIAAGLVGCSATSDPADILLFAGRGTSFHDVAAFERILNANGLHYATVGTKQLETMSESQLRAYRLLIIPGGNFEEMGNSLSPAATRHIRDAIRSGSSYLGVCAGAFMAGNSPYNGLNLTDGVRFNFYSLERQNVRKAAVPVATAGGETFEHYWEDGPQLTGWGDIVARYPDGTPAVVQGAAGNGWMILVGTHPEAPQSWRNGMGFTTSADVSNSYAATLIDAALNRKPMAHY